jgi:hypothetical protein
MLSRSQKRRASAASRKRRKKFIERSRRRRPGGVHNIPSFCLNNDISESKYFSLKRQGRGPREIELDGRILITEEAEADWRAAMEAETMAKRQAESRKASTTAATI